MQEVTARLAAAKEVSDDAAEVAVLSKLISSVEEEQRRALETFLCGEKCFLYSPLTLRRASLNAAGW